MIYASFGTVNIFFFVSSFAVAIYIWLIIVFSVEFGVQSIYKGGTSLHIPIEGNPKNLEGSTCIGFFSLLKHASTTKR
jgi:preprotein translocase subunit SecF